MKGGIDVYFMSVWMYEKLSSILIILIICASPLRAELNWGSKIIEIQMEAGNTKAYGKFTFTNTGARDVVIQEIRSCCTCVVGSTSEDKVSAGEQGEIDFVFRLQGRVGKQKKELLVVSNDPKESMTILTIIVNIE